MNVLLIKTEVKKRRRFFTSFKLYVCLSLLFIILSVHGVKSEQKSIYQSDYWGFAVKYAKDWHAWAFMSGNTYCFASYDGRDKDDWYIPNQEQLRIEVSVIPKDMGAGYKNAHIESNSKKIDALLIDGEKSVEIHEKRSVSGYELNRQQHFGIPQSQIIKGHDILRYITVHNGYTYIISAEPSNSILISEFKNFIMDFKFIKRKGYLPRSEPPIPGNAYYEDTLRGFTFEYPIDAPFRNFPSSDGGVIDKYGIVLDPVSNSDAETGNFGKDIKRYASLSCSADGPTGSVYCPEEDIRMEEFINKNNIKGVKVYRKKIEERYTETAATSTIYNDVVITYPVKVPGYFAVAFSVDDSSAKNIEMLVNIANTFKYLRLSQ